MASSKPCVSPLSPNQPGDPWGQHPRMGERKKVGLVCHPAGFIMHRALSQLWGWASFSLSYRCENWGPGMGLRAPSKCMAAPVSEPSLGIEAKGWGPMPLRLFQLPVSYLGPIICTESWKNCLEIMLQPARRKQHPKGAFLRSDTLVAMDVKFHPPLLLQAGRRGLFFFP